jgi:hypothetical protein
LQDEVVLEFHVDDTGDREDTLVEMALHVPPNNPDWKEEGEENATGGNAAKVWEANIVLMGIVVLMLF